MKSGLLFLLCFVFSFQTVFYSSALSSSPLPEPTSENSSLVIYISAPENLSIYNAKATSLSVKWSPVSSAEEYTVILRNTKSGKTVKTKTTKKNSVKFTSLSSATLYSATVVSKLQGASSEESKAVSAMTTPPKIKTVKTSEVSENTISLYWSEFKKAEGYEIFGYDKKEEKFIKIGESKNPSFDISGLKKGRVYNFKIRSYIFSNKKRLYSDFSDIHTEITSCGKYPTTKAQAASIYNNAVNEAKGQKNISISHTKTLSAEAESCSYQALFRTVKNLASLYNGEVKNTHKITENTKNNSANDILYPFGKTSSLKGGNIESYSLKKLEDGDFRLTVKLKSDTVSYNGKKTTSLSNNAQVIKTKSIKKIKVKPLVIDTYEQLYQGATIKIRLSSKGKTEKIVIESPVSLNASCHVAQVKFSAKVNYLVKESFALTY
ncbi:MAG: fibronectin type III domain-containing protein [Clostridia bacterium]|nr:fibronectin type III domain-containing protein [Clostridia bacterium]